MHLPSEAPERATCSTAGASAFARTASHRKMKSVNPWKSTMRECGTTNSSTTKARNSTRCKADTFDTHTMKVTKAKTLPACSITIRCTNLRNTTNTENFSLLRIGLRCSNENNRVSARHSFSRLVIDHCYHVRRTCASWPSSVRLAPPANKQSINQSINQSISHSGNQFVECERRRTEYTATKDQPCMIESTKQKALPRSAHSRLCV